MTQEIIDSMKELLTKNQAKGNFWKTVTEPVLLTKLDLPSSLFAKKVSPDKGDDYFIVRNADGEQIKGLKLPKSAKNGDEFKKVVKIVATKDYVSDGKTIVAVGDEALQLCD